MSDALVIGILTAVFGGGLGAAVVAFFKDRKKDNATARLTDVQALQQQVLLLSQVSDFLRKENEQLQKDYEESEDARRKMRTELERIERELQSVKLQCDRLANQLLQYLDKGQKL